MEADKRPGEYRPQTHLEWNILQLNQRTRSQRECPQVGRHGQLSDFGSQNRQHPETTLRTPPRRQPSINWDIYWREWISRGPSLQLEANPPVPHHSKDPQNPGNRRRLRVYPLPLGQRLHSQRHKTARRSPLPYRLNYPNFNQIQIDKALLHFFRDEG